MKIYKYYLLEAFFCSTLKTNYVGRKSEQDTEKFF